MKKIKTDNASSTGTLAYIKPYKIINNALCFKQWSDFSHNFHKLHFISNEKIKTDKRQRIIHRDTGKR